MKQWRFPIFLLLCAVLGLPQALGATSSQKPDGGLLAASNGNGEIRFFWFPPLGQWPEGGWRLTDDRKSVLVSRIVPMAQEAMAALSAEEAGVITELTAGIPEAAEEEEQRLIYALLGLNAMGSFESAKALGLAWVLKDVPAGKRTYRIIGLDGDGKPGKTVLSSNPVDSRVPTPLPAPPQEFRGLAAKEGASLFWKPAPYDPLMPVIAYRVERFDGGKTTSRDLDATLVLGSTWDRENPTYLDPLAPVEQDVTYRVFSIDFFGRESLPESTSFFFPDLDALQPPAEISAKPSEERIVVTWKAGDNPNTAGYVLERSTSHEGLYTPLTPDGIEPRTGQFTDTGVIGGVMYYYRLRAVGPRGNLGEPSPPAVAMPRNRKAPPEPKELTATVNPVLVTLRWERAEYPIAGYFVERRAKGAEEWSRLNGRIISEREYKDRLSPEAHGTFSYRVIAVSFDNQLSKPSKAVDVVVEDLSPPPAPRITGVDGSGGKVVLTFEPGKPEQKTGAFMLMRGLDSRKEGRVVQEDLPAKTRTFVDTGVTPGQGYWYALVALDAHKRRSEPSERRLVMVSAPEIPTPAKPAAKAVATPFAHVVIRFKNPQKPFLVALQRQDDDGSPWITVTRGISGTENVVDANPVKQGLSRYRIVLHTENGFEGEPSEPVSVKW